MKKLMFNKLIAGSLLSMSLVLGAQASTDSFIITVQTDIMTGTTGESSSTSFIIPTESGSTYDYSVDCGDASATNGVDVVGDYTCSYDSVGTYTITIDGLFPRIYFNFVGDAKKILSVRQWGTGAWDSMERAFAGTSNLITVGSDTPNFSASPSLRYMFWQASNFNSPIGHWNVSGITDMYGVFLVAGSFDQNISGWDVSSVKDMTKIFQQAYMFNADISNWDISSLETMDYMFYYAKKFNQDIGD